LEREAEEWRNAPKRDRRHRLRASGLPLAEARTLITRWGAALPPEIVEFVGASRRGARLRRLRQTGVFLGSFLAPLAIGVLVWAALVWNGVRSVEAGMTFVPIKAGCFAMGSPDGEAGRFANEVPVHPVCLQPFDLAADEVTQAQWRKVMILTDPTPSQYGGDERRPVETVSWDDIQYFLRLMSFFGSHQYRLPSESEWEYAARAGTQTARSWGDDIGNACDYENVADAMKKREAPDLDAFSCNDGFAGTAPVGSFRPNPWGLYDMLGNVAEWASDCYESDYLSAPQTNAPYTLENCTTRVVRGGSWSSTPRYIRAARRYGIAPYLRSGDFGFRLAHGQTR
jgi:sulfatase modifying factor 1